MSDANYHTNFSLSHPVEFTKEELDEVMRDISVAFVSVYSKHPEFEGKAVFYLKMEVGKKEDFE